MRLLLLLLACASVISGDATGQGIEANTVFSSESGGITDAAVASDHSLIVATQREVVLWNRGRLRHVELSGGRRFYPVRLLECHGKSTMVAGHDLQSQELLLFSTEGERITTIPASYAADFALLQRDGTELIAVEVPRRRSIAFFNLRGGRVASAEFPFYLSALQSEGETLLVAGYPNRQRGTTMYRAWPNGAVEQLHEIHAVGSFALIGADQYCVIGRRDSLEVRHRRTGEIVRSIAVSGAHEYRDIFATRLGDGSTVFALSGRGGVDRHRIVWVDGSGTVSYDVTGRRHAHAVRRGPACDVYVVTDVEVMHLSSACRNADALP